MRLRLCTKYKIKLNLIKRFTQNHSMKKYALKEEKKTTKSELN